MSVNKPWTIEDIQARQTAGTIKGFAQVAGKNIPQDPEKNIPASPLATMQALGRMKGGKMNNTEKRYADHLESLKHVGTVQHYWFQTMSLKLAEDCWYRIDFLVLLATGMLEVHEVKGHWTDDALVKIKVAAQQFPFRFIAVQYKKGEWHQRNF